MLCCNTQMPNCKYTTWILIRENIHILLFMNWFKVPFISFNSENWQAIALCDHTFCYSYSIIRYICSVKFDASYSHSSDSCSNASFDSVIQITQPSCYLSRSVSVAYPCVADTGCCALVIGKCQPQCRNHQHLIWSPTRLKIVHMQWKLKGEITMYKIKKGAKTNHKRSKCNSVDLLTPTPQRLKGRSLIRYCCKPV